MRIIQVMPEFGLAGAEVMAENLAYGLKAKEQDVMMVSFYKIHTAITDRLEKNDIRIEYLGKKKGFDFSIILKMRKLMKAYKPEVIHTHRYVLPYVFLASIGLKVKLVHTIHNIAEREVPKKQLSLQKILFKCFGVTPVAITPITQKSIIDYYGLDEKEVPLVYNGINLRQCVAKQNTEIKQDIKILHIGRFAPQKNHKMLIDAFSEVVKKYPISRLDLVGEGNLIGEIKHQVSNLGLENNVHFVGLLNNVYPKMTESDIFILPSRYEGMPITLIEAMATGLPIVATAVGGVPDMIEDKKSGILTDVSKESIAEGIITLIEDDSLRKRISNGARQAAMRFSVEKMTNAYIKIYQG